MNTIKVVALAAAVASASAEGLHGLSFPNATTTSGAVYTTEVVTVLTTFCPAATTLVMGNKTYAVTTPTTLTITDCPCTIRRPVPGHDECAKKCYDEYNNCRNVPHANMSFCTSKLAECVHYSPFDGNGSFVVPTACSAQSTGGSATGTISPPTGTGSPPTGTAPAPGQEECAKKCNDEFGACRTAPDANMSFCASKLAECVQYNPFAGNGSFVAPTACSAQSTGSSATGTGSPPTGTATGPGTGNATTTGNPPPTGAAGQLSPAFPALALLALGALALL